MSYVRSLSDDLPDSMLISGYCFTVDGGNHRRRMHTGMRTAISLGDVTATSHTDYRALADYVIEAERLGIDAIWSAEAWGSDAITPLAYMAARTERVRLATGIMQVTARAPSMTAMTALTMNRVSDGRFILGLGLSGPQVVEGLHGVPYARPLERLRETIDVVRLGLAGRRIAYEGNQIHLPLPGGEGKALRLALPPQPELPIYLATLGPKALELTGGCADGWVGTCFVPEASGYYRDHLERGAASAGRTLERFELVAGGPVGFAADPAPLLAARKQHLAFQLAAMGSPTTNFYNDAFSRIGYAEPAGEVRDLWLARRKKDAVRAVPDELAERTSLIGTPAMVGERVQAYRDAGVTMLQLQPIGRAPEQRLATLGQVLDIVRRAV
jgi:F420-dependent oxidoreductase-like protein